MILFALNHSNHEFTKSPRTHLLSDLVDLLSVLNNSITLVLIDMGIEAYILLHHDVENQVGLEIRAIYCSSVSPTTTYINEGLGIRYI